MLCSTGRVPQHTQSAHSFASNANVVPMVRSSKQESKAKKSDVGDELNPEMYPDLTTFLVGIKRHVLHLGMLFCRG